MILCECNSVLVMHRMICAERCGNMQQCTLLFVVKDGDVLLGMKKKGFGKGKWNGFGGKLNYGEEIHEAAVRETWEECMIRVREMVKHAELTFLFPVKPEWDQTVHVFVSRKWEGTPTETEEMMPKWFDIKELPLDRMWADNVHWLPKVLAGERLRAKFIFRADNETIEDVKLRDY